MIIRQDFALQSAHNVFEHRRGKSHRYFVNVNVFEICTIGVTARCHNYVRVSEEEKTKLCTKSIMRETKLPRESVFFDKGTCVTQAVDEKGITDFLITCI